jgi:hypothetical protein
MGHKVKNALLIFVLTVLSLPGLQHCCPIITNTPLNGLFIPAADVDFRWQKWWANTYQPAKNKYINDNIGLRPDLVRIINQVDYSLFKKVSSSWVAAGKGGYFYLTNHINSYYARDFIGYNRLLGKMNMMKAIQDTLAKQGKTLIMVHAPCKAFYYPDFMPDTMKGNPGIATNYETCRRIGDSLGINQIDFNAWFVSLRKTDKELLYPAQGFHWSVYGSLLAEDSLLHYIEKRRSITMRHPHWNKIEHTNVARSTDDDVFKLLNMIFPAAKETFSYPDVTYNSDSTSTRPKVMYIGDSFLLTWLDDGLMDETNSEWGAWINTMYYSNAVHPHGPQYRDMNTFDWINETKNMDCVILLYTSWDLLRLGDGYIEKAYSNYYPGGSQL